MPKLKEQPQGRVGRSVSSGPVLPSDQTRPQPPVELPQERPQPTDQTRPQQTSLNAVRRATHLEREAQRHKEMEEKAATLEIDPNVFKGAKRGWCLFRAKRRCYVEGVLIEEAGWEIALSPEAALRVRGNQHLILVAGRWPHTEEELVLDQYGDPFIASYENGEPKYKTRNMLKDKTLKDVDGDPILRRVVNLDDEQTQLRSMMGRAIGAGTRPAQFHPGYAPPEPA